MQPSVSNSTILTTKVCIRPDCKLAFADWQAKMHDLISAFPGFASLEISSPVGSSQLIWIIIQRFHDPQASAEWLKSEQRGHLIEELKELLATTEPDHFQDLEGLSVDSAIGITEVFVTQVAPEKEQIYRDWIAKVHHAESKFPGFRGVYVQTPKAGQARNWITFLQFDSQETLDRWLSSEERKSLLKEGESLIESLDSHRVISPFAGWFASAAEAGEAPPAWKQTMVVLLVLFPIVMLELKYLPYITGSFNASVSTFIGNAISVALIAWPLMPIAINFLRWWLVPNQANRYNVNLFGTLFILFLYLVEIAIFWNLL